MGNADGFAAGEDAVHDIDRDADRKHAAQCDTLVEVGDKKVSATSGGESRGDHRCTKTVGIGFDDGAAESRAHASFQTAVIGDDISDIDRENRAGEIN